MICRNCKWEIQGEHVVAKFFDTRPYYERFCDGDCMEGYEVTTGETAIGFAYETRDKESEVSNTE